MTQPEEDFIPYGPEWEKAMMRMNKDFIINMTKAALIERSALEAQNELLKDALKLYQDADLNSNYQYSILNEDDTRKMEIILQSIQK